MLTYAHGEYETVHIGNISSFSRL